MKAILNIFLVLALFFAKFSALGQEKIGIVHEPANVLKEKVNNQTAVNFDFIIENKSTDSLQLTKVLIRMFDKNNHLLKEKFFDNNGTAPSINLIPKRQWNGTGILNIFNPFPIIPANAARLVFTFTFNDSIAIDHIVKPQDYHQAVAFVLPVKGTNIVYDGHDFNAHHRRFDYEFEFIKELGFESNFMRYAYDFAQVDADGKMYRNNGENDADWFGFGSDIIAVADGMVVSVESSKPDDKKFDIARLKTDQMELFGNYVIIKHADHLFSVYGHMKQNSSQLKVGDKVGKGQKIGSIGTSGSAFMPHLHFEVRNSDQPNAQGLPSYFDNFSILMGGEKQKIKSGTVDTGDIFKSE